MPDIVASVELLVTESTNVPAAASPARPRRAAPTPHRPRRPATAVIAGLLVAGAVLNGVALAAAPPAGPPPEVVSAVTLYFATDDGRYLVPVARRISEAELSPARAVDELLAGPRAGPELRTTFAAGPLSAAFTVTGERARVELPTGALSGVDPARAIAALVLTLTDFRAIESVEVWVGGQPVGADGAVVREPVALGRPAVNPESPEASAGGVELYFAHGTVDRYLVPVTRALPPDRLGPEAALAELLAGPRAESGLERPVPPDVRLLGARMEGGLAIGDFDDRLSDAFVLAGDDGEFIRTAIIATLTALPGVEGGAIEINGLRKHLYAGRAVAPETPQARSWVVNDEQYLTAIEAAGSDRGTTVP
jgi:spore germination protein GerM